MPWHKQPNIRGAQRQWPLALRLLCATPQPEVPFRDDPSQNYAENHRKSSQIYVFRQTLHMNLFGLGIFFRFTPEDLRLVHLRIHIRCIERRRPKR